MAVEEYGKYILTSSPRRSAYFGVWLPFASVNWRDGYGWHFREFNYRRITFRTKEEAEAFGFSTARAWVDKGAVIRKQLRAYVQSRRARTGTGF
jgi:hypothetical protein